MPHLPVKIQFVRQLDELAVRPSTQEALFAQVCEQIAELPFLLLNDGCQHLKPVPVGQVRDALDNLLSTLRGDLSVTASAVPLSDSGKQHAEVVVDFGNCADRAARIPSARLLLDRNRRG